MCALEVIVNFRQGLGESSDLRTCPFQKLSREPGRRGTFPKLIQVAFCAVEDQIAIRKIVEGAKKVYDVLSPSLQSSKLLQVVDFGPDCNL